MNQLESEYMVVYENSSEEFDIGYSVIKVKVTVNFLGVNFSPFTTILVNCSVLYIYKPWHKVGSFN